MREFLNEAHAHRDDGYGRAQAQVRQELPKRFYEKVGFSTVDNGYAVELDGRRTKTPGGKEVVVPRAALAEMLVAEWEAQNGHIDPETMPVVRLINSALEAGDEVKPDLAGEIVKYCGNDLLLYRADSPHELVAAQEAAWDSVLVALARHLEVKFQPTIGIIHQPQLPETLDRLSTTIADESLIALAALVSITGLTGSGLLAIALREDLIDQDTAWAAAHVDEDHNIRLWGEDNEAAGRRAKRRLEYDAAFNVMTLLRHS